VEEPGILNIRLTDTSSEGNGGEGNQAFTVPHYCNTSPVGLFAFSMANALQTTSLLGTLVPNAVGASFVLTYGPYGFWLCGLLQLIVGMNEVRRNNIYGATAFMAFGSFWLANGTSLIIQNYFPSEIPDELLVADPVGNFIINFYVFGFVCALLKQTLVMNKLTTTLIALLAVLILSISLTGWTVVFEWIQLIFGWIVSLVAFYVFPAEFTNEVYQREVFKMYPWTIDSSEEHFGAAGRANTLQSKATKLRLAHIINSKSVHDIRTALPESKKEE
jgi:succinate-acetate transporter protein